MRIGLRTGAGCLVSGGGGMASARKFGLAGQTVRRRSCSQLVRKTSVAIIARKRGFYAIARRHGNRQRRNRQFRLRNTVAGVTARDVEFRLDARPILRRIALSAARQRLRPALAQRLRIAQVQPGQGRGSLRRFQRRQLIQRAQSQVIQKLAGRAERGRPGASRWPITSIQPRSSSALTIWDDTVTPRMSRYARHRLAPGDDRQRFHDGRRVLRRDSRLRTALKAPARGQLHRSRPPSAQLACKVSNTRARRCCRIPHRCRTTCACRPVASAARRTEVRFPGRVLPRYRSSTFIFSGPTCVGWKIRLIFFSQTRGGAVWRSSAHNPKVVGSNPAPQPN